MTAAALECEATMPNLTVSVPHQLTKEEAKRRIDDGLTQVHGQYGGMLDHMERRWQGDRLEFTARAAGSTVSGHLDVQEHAVLVEVALPWFLSMIAGGVKQTIENDTRRLLGHSKTG
jgi:putative polyhydroxyalkanoate system protein